jgi:glycosyltransferase involved in cell wall biosynthesis
MGEEVWQHTGGDKERGESGMNERRLKVLLIIYECNPEFSSVPLLGYNFFNVLSGVADVTLVTHIRNRPALEKVRGGRKIVYIAESFLMDRYSRLIYGLLYRGSINWPLLHALSYPGYAEFNRRVYSGFRRDIINGDYDVVHAMTPILPRYPYKVIKACRKTPFVLGPVNGGIPFPEGFENVAKKEFAGFNFLRAFTRLIPGYWRTYKKADIVLAGSTFTLNMVREMFSLESKKTELFFENGIPGEFFGRPRQPGSNDELLRIVFVGRLVPYKGADMVIEAIARLDADERERIRFTIVGDGSERSNLEDQVKSLELEKIVAFTGWINQMETQRYYKESDVFCFPSIREFGGAVGLEAMASGLPCIVVDYGGLGEYVTEETGFKIKPVSREYIISEIADKIRILLKDRELLSRMSGNAIERAREFAWDNKARKMLEVYERAIKNRN